MKRDKVDKFFTVKQLWMCYSKHFSTIKVNSTEFFFHVTYKLMANLEKIKVWLTLKKYT